MAEYSDGEGSGLELVHISDVLDYLGMQALWSSDFLNDLITRFI